MKYIILSLVLLISINTHAQKIIAPEIILEHRTFVITINDSIAQVIKVNFPEADYQCIMSPELNVGELTHYREHSFCWKRFPKKKFDEIILKQTLCQK